MTDVRLLYVTAKGTAEAHGLARALLERRLIACANVFPQIESIYRWKEKTETTTEVVLILKTTKELVAGTTEAIRELHSYEIPCVLELAVESGEPDYLKWLTGEVR